MMRGKATILKMEILALYLLIESACSIHPTDKQISTSNDKTDSTMTNSDISVLSENAMAALMEFQSSFEDFIFITHTKQNEKTRHRRRVRGRFGYESECVFSEGDVNAIMAMLKNIPEDSKKQALNIKNLTFTVSDSNNACAGMLETFQREIYYVANSFNSLIDAQVLDEQYFELKGMCKGVMNYLKKLIDGLNKTSEQRFSVKFKELDDAFEKAKSDIDKALLKTETLVREKEDSITNAWVKMIKLGNTSSAVAEYIKLNRGPPILEKVIKLASASGATVDQIADFAYNMTSLDEVLIGYATLHGLGKKANIPSKYNELCIDTLVSSLKDKRSSEVIDFIESSSNNSLAIIDLLPDMISKSYTINGFDETVAFINALPWYSQMGISFVALHAALGANITEDHIKVASRVKNAMEAYNSTDVKVESENFFMSVKNHTTDHIRNLIWNSGINIEIAPSALSLHASAMGKVMLYPSPYTSRQQWYAQPNELGDSFMFINNGTGTALCANDYRPYHADPEVCGGSQYWYVVPDYRGDEFVLVNNNSLILGANPRGNCRIESGQLKECGVTRMYDYVDWTARSSQVWTFPN